MKLKALMYDIQLHLFKHKKEEELKKFISRYTATVFDIRTTKSFIIFHLNFYFMYYSYKRRTALG